MLIAADYRNYSLRALGIKRVSSLSANDEPQLLTYPAPILLREDLPAAENHADSLRTAVFAVVTRRRSR